MNSFLYLIGHKQKSNILEILQIQQSPVRALPIGESEVLLPKGRILDKR